MWLYNLVMLEFLLGSTPAAAQNTAFLDDPRVSDAAVIRQMLETGDGRAAVIISLEEPLEISTFADWRDPRAARNHRERVESMQRTVLDGMPPAEFTLQHRLENLPIVSGEITAVGLRTLLANPRIELIEVDGEVRPHTQQGIALMDGGLPRSAFSGSGVSIAIVDTGIDYNHVKMGNAAFPNAKVIGGYDFGDDDADPLDVNGHGTSAAAVAAGTIGAVGDYVGGVAVFAKLYALKVFPDEGESASTSDILAAWDWCITHQDDDPENPILVINNSLGGGYYTSACGSGSFASTADDAAAAGITIIASSGNEGFCDALASPACTPAVISVGAVYDADIGSYSPLHRRPFLHRGLDWRVRVRMVLHRRGDGGRSGHLLLEQRELSRSTRAVEQSVRPYRGRGATTPVLAARRPRDRMPRAPPRC